MNPIDLLELHRELEDYTELAKQFPDRGYEKLADACEILIMEYENGKHNSKTN